MQDKTYASGLICKTTMLSWKLFEEPEFTNNLAEDNSKIKQFMSGMIFKHTFSKDISPP